MTENENKPQPRCMAQEDLDGVAKVHWHCFPDTDSVFIGLDDDLLKRYYLQAAEEPESVVVVLEEPDSGNIVGFAIGTMKPGFPKRFLRRYLFKFVWNILRVFFVNPLVRKAMCERIRHIKRLIIGKGDVELADLGVSVPESEEAYLMRVGVDAKWRGGGNAERLMKYFAAEMFKKGVNRIRGSVPPENMASLIMYKCLGWNTKKISSREVCVWFDRPNSAS